MTEQHHIFVPRAGLEPAYVAGISGKTRKPREGAGIARPLVFPSGRGYRVQYGTPAVPSFPEVAWDGRGRWCGDGPPPGVARPPLDVPHACGSTGRRRADCGTFVCFLCDRAVPWCFGGSGDDRIEDVLCDDCWCGRRGQAGKADQAVAS